MRNETRRAIFTFQIVENKEIYIYAEEYINRAGCDDYSFSLPFYAQTRFPRLSIPVGLFSAT